MGYKILFLPAWNSYKVFDKEENPMTPSTEVAYFEDYALANQAAEAFNERAAKEEYYNDLFDYMFLDEYYDPFTED